MRESITIVVVDHVFRDLACEVVRPNFQWSSCSADRRSFDTNSRDVGRWNSRIGGSGRRRGTATAATATGWYASRVSSGCSSGWHVGGRRKAICLVSQVNTVFYLSSPVAYNVIEVPASNRL